MGERIRMIRKALGLTQNEFGERIGVKQGTVAGYETSGKNPLDTVIAAICREFNVDEEWIRTGEGEMFRAVTRDEQIARFVGEILTEDDDFRRQFISILAQMTAEEWEVIRIFARKLAEKGK